ncbi:uncharacterized protein I206_101521 [Kwoniella pini CBS 10737]|uniref:Uncharacterized protein n=1 Tax=Kwoniella pini CBS 10737 TaxID=1296096 RepID=A0A1B9HWF5_9TREE|nr:uncharacterized protein I206_06507 [Kwoniella pini CBS 10737]OCF47604.1 hypothetical protein I206_06507 [Kwoniella pini CBS 10737]
MSSTNGRVLRNVEGNIQRRGVQTSNGNGSEYHGDNDGNVNHFPTNRAPWSRPAHEYLGNSSNPQHSHMSWTSAGSAGDLPQGGRGRINHFGDNTGGVGIYGGSNSGFRFETGFGDSGSPDTNQHTSDWVPPSTESGREANPPPTAGATAQPTELADATDSDPDVSVPDDNHWPTNSSSGSGPNATQHHQDSAAPDAYTSPSELVAKYFKPLDGQTAVQADTAQRHRFGSRPNAPESNGQPIPTAYGPAAEIGRYIFSPQTPGQTLERQSDDSPDDEWEKVSDESTGK